MPKEPRPAPREIERVYDSGENRLTQERHDSLLPQVIDFAREKKRMNLRPTSATSAPLDGPDIAELQEWLGPSSISTTRLYDKRKMRPEDSPTFKIEFK